MCKSSGRMCKTFRLAPRTVPGRLKTVILGEGPAVASYWRVQVTATGVHGGVTRDRARREGKGRPAAGPAGVAPERRPGQHELLGILVGQRPQERGVDEDDPRRVRPDPQGQRRDYDEGEGRLPQGGPNREPEI